MKQMITKRRYLPSPGTITKAIGERVAFDDIVGKVGYVPGALLRLDAAKHLGILPSRVGSVLTHDIEDFIATGEVLAESSSFFWSRKLQSPIDGYLAMYSTRLGYIYIREPVATVQSDSVVISHKDLGLSKLQFSERVLVSSGQMVSRGQHLLRGGKYVALALSRVISVSLFEGEMVLEPIFHATEITAFIDGVVIAVEEADSCLVAAKGYRFKGEVGYGGEAVGRLRVLQTANLELDASDLPDDLADCIIVVQGSVSEVVLSRLAEQNIAGLVMGYAEPLTLKRFLPSNPLQHLGMLMETPFPIMLINGFTKPITGRVFKQIALLDGQQAALDAATQIRAGIIRPELLIALADEEIDLAENYNNLYMESAGLYEGAKVVILREPHPGEEGMLQKISSTREETPAGTLTTLATVLLDNGKTVQVPVFNCRVLGDN